MSLYSYLKTKSSLPTAKDTGLGETTTKEANAAGQRVLTEQSQCTGGSQTQGGGNFTPHSVKKEEQLLVATLQNTAMPLLVSRLLEKQALLSAVFFT